MYSPKYVLIDLSTKEIKDYPISKENFKLYIGGKTLGAKILYDELASGVDPLSPENIFIVNTGPLNGTGAPASSRFNITTKNVLTNGIGSSNCGGTFGFKLRKAGYDGLIIKGKSDNPVFIEVIDGNIKFIDAEDKWGLDTEKVQEEFNQKYGKLVIGPSGENLVKYACAVSGERVAGRCGVGAVMGSKNLKGIIAYGTKPIYNEKPDKFKKFVKKWVKNLAAHPITGEGLPHGGSAGLLTGCNAMGILPTKNFALGKFDNADKISTDTLNKDYLVRNGGCISCPIRCERRVKVNGKEVKGPEYETVGLLGSNIDNSDLGLINELNYYADIYGVDTISLGSTISFAMELQEKGIKDFGLKFGEFDNIKEVIESIAKQEGKYAELAEGSALLSKKYGGEEFAMHVKGMEIAAYDPRKSNGMGLGYATSNRGGCHINGGYTVLLENLSVLTMNGSTPKGKPQITIMFQNLMEAISASGFCIQTVQTAIPSVAFKMKPAGTMSKMVGSIVIGLRGVLGSIWKLLPGLVPIHVPLMAPHSKAIQLATGVPMSFGKLLQLGERGFNIERMFNVREGIYADHDNLPARLLNEPLEGEKNNVVSLNEMLPVYYKVRGWDKYGIPAKKKKKQLGIK